MGAGVSTAVNNTRTTISNDVYQKADNVCRADCTNEISNIDIVVDGSNIPGGIEFKQACTAQALCTMRTVLDSVVNQNSVTNQEADSTAGPPLFSASVATSINNSRTNIQNTTTQIISNVCEASTSNLITDVNILISDSNVAYIAFDQEGNATADCAIDSTASSTVDQTSRTEQTATATTGIDLGALIAIVVIAIVGGIVMQQSNSNKQNKDETIDKLSKSGGTVP